MRKARAAIAFAIAVTSLSSVALAQRGAPKGTDSSITGLPPAKPNAVGVGLNGEKSEPAKKAEPANAEPAAADDEGTSTDVTERPGKTYYFVGLRYGLTVIPKFVINLFVNEGATFTTNTIGAEFEMRHNGFSLIPSLSYAEYGSGDVLFKQKNTPDSPQNYSLVNSSLKALYLGADLLWSARISRNVDFEYGAGFGLGIIFGDLVNNWVYQANANTPGALQGSNGNYYAPCQAGNTADGCTTQTHQNASVAKVGGYTEPSWANGGSKPNIFPRVLLHLAGVRIKPVKQFEGRLGIGLSLTEGFWFGLSGSYGLERPEKRTTASSPAPTLSWH